MSDPSDAGGNTGTPAETSAFQVEVGHGGDHAIVDGLPDQAPGSEVPAHRGVGDAHHAAVHIVAPEYVEVPVDVSTTTDPHHDYTSTTGQNDSSVSDSPIASEHDSPVEAASDPTPEEPPSEPPPEEKHEDPPPDHSHDSDPAHEPSGSDSTHSDTEGSDGHHD